jgi:hypothetical protein
VKIMRVSLLAIAAVVGSAAFVSAQPVPGKMPPPPFVPMQGEGAFERQTVRGAPYSATTETELVQTLADGNRISGRWTGFVARDGEGRVRREQPLAAIGALLAGPDAPRLTVITDPVLRVTWFLDPEAKRARRMAWPPEGGRGQAGGKSMPGPVFGGRGPLGLPPEEAGAASTESLGSREIAGVKAEGTRSTYVIPAGQIGNDRALSIVSERWSCAELDVVLETRHSDPRLGETRFRVTEVERGEPDHALFEVPAGYVVEDGPPPMGGRSGPPGGRPPKDP